MMTAGGGPALGSVWRITAKNSDFYLDGFGPEGVMHLSLHGPGERHAAHRFHLKLDRPLAPLSEVGGHVVVHGIPRRGQSFSGKKVADNAWLVARIRWPWHLQRRKYRTAALHRGVVPEPDSGFQRGAQLRTLLKAGRAWDVDLFASHDEPYWPPIEPGRRAHGDPRLGPLTNDSGMWLTGSSAHRSSDDTPVPQALEVPLPRPHEQARRIILAGLDPVGDFYWFTETITAGELVEHSRLAIEDA